MWKLTIQRQEERLYLFSPNPASLAPCGHGPRTRVGQEIHSPPGSQGPPHTQKREEISAPDMASTSLQSPWARMGRTA